MKCKTVVIISLALPLFLTSCSSGANSADSQKPSSPPYTPSKSPSSVPIESPTEPPGYCHESVFPYMTAVAYHIRTAKAEALNPGTLNGGETLASVDLRVAHQTLDAWAKQNQDCVLGSVSKFLDKLTSMDSHPFTRKQNADLKELGDLGLLAAASLTIDESFNPISGPHNNSGDSDPGLPSGVRITPKSFDSDTVKSFLELYN